MRLKITALFLIVFSFLFLVFPLKNAHADTFTLSGSVTDASGIAIGNAAVHVYTSGTKTDVVTSATTDSSTGAYSFNAVPTGTYDVQVIPQTGSGFSSAIAFKQNISTSTILNFILDPTGTITLSGHIFDRNGTAVQNAKVSFQDVSVSTVTDDRGWYSLTASSGTHTLDITGKNTDQTVALPAYYDATAYNYSITQSALFDITLPTKQVTIHVQDSQANPVSVVGIGANDAGGPGSPSTTRLPLGGGTATVWGVSEYGTAFNRYTPVTDASGNVTLWLFGDAINNRYNFTATPPSGSGFLATPLSNVYVTADTQQAITLQQPVTLTGHIFDKAGHALVNQTVQFTDVNATSTTDGSGFYSLTAAPGKHTLVISGKNTDTSLNIPGYYKVTANGFALTQSTSLDITIPTKQVVVHIEDAFGNALSGITVTAVDSGGSEAIATTNITVGNITNAWGVSEYGTSVSGTSPQTDASGNATLWLFANNSSSPYVVTATPPTGSSYQTMNITNTNIAGDTNLSMTLQEPITIHGQVTDRTGHFVIGATVKLKDVGVTKTTDTSGSYSFDTSAGVHTLEIQGTNYSSSPSLPAYYDVVANNVSFTEPTTLNITIPAQQVSIHVQDAAGNPVGGIGISAQDEGGPGSLATTQLPIGGSINNAWGISEYGTILSGNAPQTDSSGNVTLWLFADSGNHSYLFTATPPIGGVYKTFTLNNIVIRGDQAEVVALQYNHAAPTTTATLFPSPFADGTYSDPTTVTLSASAADTYTIANTYYTVDGGAQQTYTAPFTVRGSGDHTITYWSVDSAGVPEAANTKSLTITETYNLSGTVYNDNNQNGIQDQGETGFSGATITLNSGQTATTDSNGNYTFAEIEPGAYVTTLTLPDGYTATTGNPVNVALAAATTANFGITHTAPTTTASLSPDPFADGTYPNPVTVTLSATAETGFDIDRTYYTIDGGAQQSYTTPFTVSGSGDHTVTYWSVDKTGLQEAPNTKTFTIAAFTLSGTVYNDDNENGFQDTEELGFQGATVTLNTGQSTATDASGTYSFANLQPGTYTETLTIPTGYTATTTDPATVALGADTTQNFGLYSAPVVRDITSAPNPVQIDTAVSTSATFTDGDATDTHTATWNWGDGTTSAGVVTESNGTTSRSVAGTHTYTTAGVYTVTLTVSDDDGASGTATYQYVSVYNPTSQGIFSAGQRLSSPAGAYAQNPSLTGTVKFGLSYKYSGTVPVGDRQFTMTFSAANLIFNATNVSSLVTANGIGTLTGTGTINGSGTYNYLVTGDENANTIRIKITDQSGNVIYDTQPGAAADAEPSTSVIGNVIAH
jgi:protocatechuate 3,4-dioxygenase beta subunit